MLFLFLFSLSRCKWGTFITPSPKCNLVAVSWLSWCPLWCAVCCCCCALWVGCVHTLTIKWEMCACCSNGCSRCETDKKEFGGHSFTHVISLQCSAHKDPTVPYAVYPLCSPVCLRVYCFHTVIFVQVCVRSARLVHERECGFSHIFLLWICSQIFTFLLRQTSFTHALTDFWTVHRLTRDDTQPYFNTLKTFWTHFWANCYVLIYWLWYMCDNCLWADVCIRWFLSFSALIVYCTKSRRAERYWQKTLLQMEEMESQIREEIRKGVFTQERTHA